MRRCTNAPRRITKNNALTHQQLFWKDAKTHEHVVWQSAQTHANQATTSTQVVGQDAETDEEQIWQNAQNQKHMWNFEDTSLLAPQTIGSRLPGHRREKPYSQRAASRRSLTARHPSASALRSLRTPESDTYVAQQKIKLKHRIIQSKTCNMFSATTTYVCTLFALNCIELL